MSHVGAGPADEMHEVRQPSLALAGGGRAPSWPELAPCAGDAFGLHVARGERESAGDNSFLGMQMAQGMYVGGLVNE